MPNIEPINANILENSRYSNPMDNLREEDKIMSQRVAILIGSRIKDT